MTPEQALAYVATELGLEEFERTGSPESVRPRHYRTARAAVEATADVLRTEARDLEGGPLVGVRRDVLLTGADLLEAAADAPGPDR